MLYLKKLSLFIKSLNFVVLLTSASAVIAADESTNLIDNVEQSKILTIQVIQPEHNVEQQVEQTNKLTFGRKEFISSEKKLIEGRQLNLWGVGLFSSPDLVGTTIRRLTKSSWSHVGLILQDEIDSTLFSFEATGSATQILDAVLPQVQINKWEDIVKNYNGTIAYRQFKFSEQTPKHEDVLKYVNVNLGKPYEKNLSSLIKAVYGENEQSDVSSVFCSEMAADCLITLGYLDKQFQLADNYVPHHFCDKVILPWTNGASLGTQVIAKGKISRSCCTIM